MLLTVITSIIIALVLLILIWCIHYSKYYEFLKRFPGPQPIPFIGNAHEFPDITTALPIFLNYVKKYGDTIRLMVGFHFGLLVTNQEMVEFILNSNKLIEKAIIYKTFFPWLGTGLLTSKGEKWRRHRKVLTPAFHFQILEDFLDVFNSAGNILVKKLENELGRKSTDIFPYITLCALDTICESAMGTKVNAQEDDSSEYVRCIKEVTRIAMRKIASPIKIIDFTYKFTLDYYREKRALKTIHNYSTSIINKRRQECYSKNGIKSDSEERGKRKRLAFLDILLQATINGEPISDNDIREEVDTFMFEGHDTVTSAISFTLLCLANHGEIQAKVMEEQEYIFGDNFYRPSVYSDLQNMKYLEMVIKETMRLYPSVFVIGRNVSENIEYKGTVLPKGLILGIFIFAIGRDPKIYPEPEKFDPERFNLKNTSLRGPFNYLPFSAGPRNCIGQKFAMLEMKSIISKILRTYELLPTQPQHIPVLMAETILRSDNGICIRLKRRLRNQI